MKDPIIIVLGITLFVGMGVALASPDKKLSDGTPETWQRATFAGGCFWCMEPPFDKLDGVLSTTVGYTGGSEKNPTYKDVVAGGTGHAEAIQIVFDPSRITYEELLDVFWKNIDPTQIG